MIEQENINRTMILSDSNGLQQHMVIPTFNQNMCETHIFIDFLNNLNITEVFYNDKATKKGAEN